VSKYRQPFEFEEGFEEHHRQLQEVKSSGIAEPSLPAWAFGGTTATGGEHEHARRAMAKMAKRHMDHAHSQGVSDYTYAEAEEAGRACAYRYDERNN
jgi:hypothetical protein